MRARVFAILLLVLALGLFGQVMAGNGNPPSINRAAVFDMPVSSNANVLTASLTPASTTAAFHIQVGVNTDSIVNVQVSNGTYAKGFDLNDGTALTAGRLYAFTIAAVTTSSAGTALSYNFQCETSTTITLFVDESKVGNR